MLKGWFSQWIRDRRDIARYATSERDIFFSLALQYLPEGPVTAVDVGCGASNFGKQVMRTNHEAIMHCLDGNFETVETLRKEGFQSRMYLAPERLPFDDQQVGFIHCSHLIEHLQPQELYLLLQEFTRVLSDRGILVISAPILWDGFYNDLSHIRPYSSFVIDNYLISTVEKTSHTRKCIKQFRREAKVCRYQKTPVFNTLGLRGESWLMDLVIQLFKKMATRVGMYKLMETGYTVVYQKNK